MWPWAAFYNLAVRGLEIRGVDCVTQIYNIS